LLYLSGLRHWSEEDDPWVEHARFGIDCPFVLEQRGAEFVQVMRMAISDDPVQQQVSVQVKTI